MSGGRSLEGSGTAGEYRSVLASRTHASIASLKHHSASFVQTSSPLHGGQRTRDLPSFHECSSRADAGCQHKYERPVATGAATRNVLQRIEDNPGAAPQPRKPDVNR
eukprot:7381270-Prymnesium_polylepis.1